MLRCTLELDNARPTTGSGSGCRPACRRIAAVAGGPFGAAGRPAVAAESARYPNEAPVATAPAQRYVAVADEVRGLTLLAPGFFEYELGADGDCG